MGFFRPNGRTLPVWIGSNWNFLCLRITIDQWALVVQVHVTSAEREQMRLVLKLSCIWLVEYVAGIFKSIIVRSEANPNYFMINFDLNWKVTPIIPLFFFGIDFCRSLILTSSVSIEFGPQRDVSSPADWVNADKTSPDCRWQAPFYNSVPISICTEKLTINQKEQ